MRIFCRFLAIFLLFFANSAFATSILMEDMTWPEIAQAIKDSYTTVIIPTGGTEQNGPHIVLGKHNFVLYTTAPAIAGKLGHTLVAPVMQYVPEGNITPPTGHMQFPGTLSLRPETFAAMLEDTARSLKQHGFKLICFVGEHGASQPIQAKVAEKLSNEWKSDGVKVLQVSDYYDKNNGQIAWLKQANPKIEEHDIEAHGGLADTSEMLAAHAEGVRESLRSNYKLDDFTKLGVDGSSADASADMGKKFLDLKIEAAVKQIEKARGQQ